MWDFQDNFRIWLEDKAKRVLQELAPTLEPESLLVGIRVPEEEDEPPVCVEPDVGEWDPQIFFDCASRVDELYEEHRGHNIHPDNVRRSCVQRAVCEAFDSYDQAHGTKTICARWPERIGHYYVMCALQFNKAAYDEYPKLSEPIQYGEFSFSGGFLDRVVDGLLQEAQNALWSPDPGGSFGVLFLEDSDSILRKAGERFCSVISLATRDMMQNIFGQIDSISALYYEGAEVAGKLVFAPLGHAAVGMQIEFSDAIPLEEPRWARKILEMGTGDLCCVCSGTSGIRGLGVLVDPEAEGVFWVEYAGHFKWQLCYRGNILLRSSFGVPRLPRPILKEATFRSTFRRVFDGIGVQDEERIWQIVQAATRQRHGTMIVVSGNAENEAKRLRNQAIPVTPVLLSAELVDRVSGIDGAVLVDEHGTCWALGVILDGLATGVGNPARGARYNSAVRYYSSQNSVATLILIVSEDGSVDMIPSYLPKIARSEVERWIDRLKKCNADNYHKTRRWLAEHRFYLTDSQCEVVNGELMRIEGMPSRTGRMRFKTGKFLPHPDMSDSYYLPEP